MILVCAVWATSAQAQNGCLTGRYAQNTVEGTVVGGIVGGIIGNAIGGHRHRTGSTVTGVAIGAGMGSQIGCWTANEQAIAAAREDSINSQVDDLEARTNQLHAYNQELLSKIANIRSALAQARRSESTLSKSYRDRLAYEHDQASNQLDAVRESQKHVNKVASRLSPDDQQYARKNLALQTERNELSDAEANLRTILSMTA
jgi:hypothetical protein